MLTEIGDAYVCRIDVERVKQGEFRLMGFGHRVYKNYDPWAKIIKEIAHDVFERDRHEPAHRYCDCPGRVALSDDYFVGRKLYPNVDSDSGIIYQAMRASRPKMFNGSLANGLAVAAAGSME